MRTTRSIDAMALTVTVCAIVIALVAVQVLWPRQSAPPTDAFGVTLAPTGNGEGLVVNSLRADGAARRAGLAVGDRLEAIDGRSIRSPLTLQHVLELRRRVVLHVRRHGHVRDVTLEAHRETRWRTRYS